MQERYGGKLAMTSCSLVYRSVLSLAIYPGFLTPACISCSTASDGVRNTLVPILSLLRRAGEISREGLGTASNK